MTIPAPIATGTGHATSVPWPTHAAGDFGLLLTENDVDTIATPSGWEVGPKMIATAAGTVLQSFWRFATSSGESNAAISASNHSWGCILTFSDVNRSNPLHTSSKHYSTASAAARYCQGGTTYLPDCYALACYAYHLDSAGPMSSGEANSTLGSVVELQDGGTTDANGGGIIVIGGTKVTEGFVGPTAITPGGTIGVATLFIALQSANQTFGVMSRIVNRGDQAMPIPVKQSTAQTVGVWMADTADGKTGKTGLTLAITLKKYGETSFSSIAPTVTEIGSGHYDVALTTTHCNTVGVLSVRATSAGADPADCCNIIDVIAYDKTAATNMGLTAVPAVASGSAGAIPTTGTGANQIAVDGSGNARADIRVIAAGIIARAAIAQDVRDMFGEVHRGTATAGGASTITFAVGASSVDDAYKNGIVFCIAGTGARQWGTITGYVGSTRVATVTPAWAIATPDATTDYTVFPTGGSVEAASVAAAVWNALTASYAVADTFGAKMANLDGAITDIPTANENATAVWDHQGEVSNEGTHSMGDLQRLAADAHVGPTDYSTDDYEFKSLDGSKVRATVTIDGDDNRSVTEIGDLT